MPTRGGNSAIPRSRRPHAALVRAGTPGCHPLAHDRPRRVLGAGAYRPRPWSALGQVQQTQSIPATVPAGVTSAGPAGRNQPTLPPTERAAMALRVAGSRVSSVLSGIGRDQRPGVASPSAATIPARTSGRRLAHAATRRARSASGGQLPAGRRPAPRLAPGAACAAPGAARCSESAYSPGDSASAWGFDSPRLHS